MNNQFTQRVSDIIMYSKEEANRLRNSYIGPEHLLLGLIREGEGKAIEILFNLQINLQDIKNQLEAIVKNNAENDTTYDENISFNDKASKVLKLCILEAKLLRNIAADSEHILLAIMKVKDNAAFHVLESNGVTYEKIKLTLQPDTHAGLGFSEDEDEDEDIRQSPSGNKSNAAQQQARPAQKKPANDTPVLDNFGTDMTKAAEEGKLDPVVGRVKEIERLAQILSRRKKNNPILIGEPGVGKSAIVEGLALRIVEKKVSRILFDKRVIALDMTAVVAGTKYRGQFEERIRSILNELKKNPNIILFIDEIHTLIGAGGAEGSMDAANIMKPALARGFIQCIGATTLNEYRKSIEKDGALERRFQKIIVEPTTAEETLEILHNIKEKYEEHHNVSYTDEALKACVKLADRYMHDRSFPDKAIDVMDEAGAHIHINSATVPDELIEAEKKLNATIAKKQAAVASQNFEMAATLRDYQTKQEHDIEMMRKQWEHGDPNHRVTLDETEIAKVVSNMTGIPVQQMAESENIRLRNMGKVLKEKVIAQDAAIDKVVKSIQRNRMGLKDPNHPIGVFMFLGPTGVGKTYLAKKLAEEMFGSADALFRIDMSEYAEGFNTSRLIGSPPGYVGYDEGGQLTEKVRRKPYSIVLLDEIEKANTQVFNLLLQVMDEGRLTDGNGRLIDFRNTIIIMTSNAGTRQLKEFGRGVGFNAGGIGSNGMPIDEKDKEYARSVIQKHLSKQFAPEFLNRLDEIITFDQLDLSAITSIVDLELKSLVKRVENLGYHFQMTDKAKEFVASKGYDVQFGARPLKRAIQNYVEDGLCELLMEGNLKPGATISIGKNPKKDELTFKNMIKD